MAYADYSDYTALYGAEIKETDFSRYAWEASRFMDTQTTGIDGYRKLREAFPTDEGDKECVKRCMCALVKLMADIEAEEERRISASGTVMREDGVTVGRVVTSVSSGSESISYSMSGEATSISTAVSDSAVRRELFCDTVHNYLTGIKDAAGVSLLYMGAYPRGNA